MQWIVSGRDRKLGIRWEETVTLDDSKLSNKLSVLIIFLSVFAEACARQPLFSLAFVLSETGHERLLGKQPRITLPLPKRVTIIWWDLLTSSICCPDCPEQHFLEL